LFIFCPLLDVVIVCVTHLAPPLAPTVGALEGAHKHFR
jgi:hypothetical protein